MNHRLFRIYLLLSGELRDLTKTYSDIQVSSAGASGRQSLNHGKLIIEI
jgi:hypothetical protein